MRLLLALLLVVPAFAQPAPEVATVMGVVVEAETGEPLIGASVWIPTLHIGASTDLEGRFSFGVPAGVHVVRIESVGYERVEREVSLSAGQTWVLAPELTRMDWAGDCIVVCAMDPWPTRGLYAARVVRYVSEPSCCDDGGAPLDRPHEYLRDR